jgi:hypothetical protein
MCSSGETPNDHCRAAEKSAAKRKNIAMDKIVDTVAYRMMRFHS